MYVKSVQAQCTSIGVVVRGDGWQGTHGLRSAALRYFIDPGSLKVKVSDSRPVGHEFEPSTAEDPPCRGMMHVKSVKSSNILPLVWCGS
ncbi:hypothetical protein TNCV_4382991 [Trichonephila clavipes]|nr:hypothetical protein TNCV_4382991 [Trichonephila clavipes]